MTHLAEILGFFLTTIYKGIGSYGLAIILFTVLVKIALLPLSVKQIKSTHSTSKINPKIKEIQAKYKNNQEKQAKAISELYKETGYNPMSGCLPMLIQMPILLALYWVFSDPVKYGVFSSLIEMNNYGMNFLWIEQLSKPDYIIAILSAVSAYLMQKYTMLQSASDGMNKTMKMMSNIMPIMSLVWGVTLPAALTLYWTVSNAMAIVQQILVVTPLKRKLE